MSLDELEQAGILLPREKWGTHDIHTNVAKIPLLILGALAPVAAALMYVGNGTGLTWAGLGLFFVLMAAFTWLSLRGIRSD